EEGDSVEATKRKQIIFLYVAEGSIVLILGLVVFFTVRRNPEHNISTLELFRFRKFRANRKKMRRDRLVSDWLFQKNTLPYLLRIVGDHFIVFMIVVA